MNYLAGSAIKIKSEVSVVSGSTVTLLKLLGADGTTEILTNEAMSFDTMNTSVAFMIWQSTANTHVAGKYTYLTKVVNGIYSNIAKGQFDLEAQP